MFLFVTNAFALCLFGTDCEDVVVCPTMTLADVSGLSLEDGAIDVPLDVEPLAVVRDSVCISQDSTFLIDLERQETIVPIQEYNVSQVAILWPDLILEPNHDYAISDGTDSFTFRTGTDVALPPSETASVELSQFDLAVDGNSARLTVGVETDTPILVGIGEQTLGYALPSMRVTTFEFWDNQLDLDEEICITVATRNAAGTLRESSPICDVPTEVPFDNGRGCNTAPTPTWALVLPPLLLLLRRRLQPMLPPTV